MSKESDRKSVGALLVMTITVEFMAKSPIGRAAQEQQVLVLLDKIDGLLAVYEDRIEKRVREEFRAASAAGEAELKRVLGDA